jgi:NAD(P)-dependent dehydrogenase (short-subunit alcohol dehydrogenase family)
VHGLREALDPLGQRLRTPAERRVHRRLVSAQRSVVGHDALGRRVPVEGRAQARHGTGEVAPCDAGERELFRPAQVFLAALHGLSTAPEAPARNLGAWFSDCAWDFDILVNNAGIGEGGPIAEIPLDLVRHNFEVNVFAPLAFTQKVVRNWVAAKSHDCRGKEGRRRPFEAGDPPWRSPCRNGRSPPRRPTR